MKTPLERLDTAIMDAIEHSPKKTLQALTGAFVGLTIGLLEDAGHTPEGDIKIDSCGGRDITIHAKELL